MALAVLAWALALGLACWLKRQRPRWFVTDLQGAARRTPGLY